MRMIPVVFSMVLAVGYGAAMAQALPRQFGAVQPPARDYASPHDSREQLPPVALPAGLPQTRKQPTLLPNQVIALPNSARLRQQQTCYVIDSYNYESTNSLVETPKPSGQTTCVASSESKLKGARGVVVLR